MQDNGLKELAAYEQGGESRQLVKLNNGDKIHVGGIYLNYDLNMVRIKRLVHLNPDLYEASDGRRYFRWDLFYEIHGEFVKELLAAGFFKNL